MELTKEFIAKLRREFSEELDFQDHPPSVEGNVLAAFDRACLSTVLSNGAAPEARKPNYHARALKAARTRKENKLRKEEGNATGTASNQ